MLRWSWIAMCVVFGCENATPPGTAMPAMPMTVPGAAAMPFTAAPVATAVPASPSSTDELPCFVYPRRCEDGCKRAFHTAMSRPEMSWDPSLLPPDVATQLGTCAANCVQRRAGEPLGCVGAATEAECACQAQCQRTAKLAERVTPEAAMTIRRAPMNLEAAIAPACR